MVRKCSQYVDSVARNVQTKYYSTACSRKPTILHKRALTFCVFQGPLIFAASIPSWTCVTSHKCQLLGDIFRSWDTIEQKVMHACRTLQSSSKRGSGTIVNTSHPSCHHSFLALLCGTPTLKGYHKCTRERRKSKRQGTAIGAAPVERRHYIEEKWEK